MDMTSSHCVFYLHIRKHAKMHEKECCMTCNFRRFICLQAHCIVHRLYESWWSAAWSKFVQSLQQLSIICPAFVSLPYHAIFSASKYFSPLIGIGKSIWPRPDPDSILATLFSPWGLQAGTVNTAVRVFCKISKREVMHYPQFKLLVWAASLSNLPSQLDRNLNYELFQHIYSYDSYIR